MENDFKFSIIMSIYNVAEYLEEAVDSVINQTIGFEDNVQIILVNDGSTDNSEEICLEYKRKYPENIIAISKENGGLSSSRNCGLNYVTGEYVNFFDPDDILSEDTLEHVYKFFKEHDLICEKLMVKSFMPIALPGSLLWDLTPPEQRCYDWEKYYIIPENPLREPQIFYRDSNFKIEELYKYGMTIEKDLFENSNISDNDLFIRDLSMIIDEGYYAIESEMDKEWFKLSVDYTVKKYLDSK